MVSKNLVSQYDYESHNWLDGNGVDYEQRLNLFLEILKALTKSSPDSLSSDEELVAKFLFYSYWFEAREFTFETEIVRERSPFENTFFRIDYMKDSFNLLASDAYHIAKGVEDNPFLRLVMMALIVEATRKSRLLRALELRRPVYLAKYNMLLSALGPSGNELAIHGYFVEKKLMGEFTEVVTRCQLKSCANRATWMVMCPHEDGREYLCHQHKSENDLSFETFRLVFSTSCRHHADRRDCTYVMISI